MEIKLYYYCYYKYILLDNLILYYCEMYCLYV